MCQHHAEELWNQSFDDFFVHVDDTTKSEQAVVGRYVVRQIIYEFNKNSKGPKTVPWGMPNPTEAWSQLEWSPPILGGP